jgi:structural maintenance of chromosome 1
MVYERESQIAINYTRLERRLKELEAVDEVHRMGEELTAKVGKLQSTLQRINAPNMKALEKLEGGYVSVSRDWVQHCHDGC